VEFVFRELMGEDVKIRFRPHYFSYTEPSYEIDFANALVKKMGKDWLEIAGCGMVHPQVFENVGYDPAVWTGWAFGWHRTDCDAAVRHQRHPAVLRERRAFFTAVLSALGGPLTPEGEASPRRLVLARPWTGGRGRPDAAGVDPAHFCRFTIGGGRSRLGLELEIHYECHACSNRRRLGSHADIGGGFGFVRRQEAAGTGQGTGHGHPGI
jgi:hypothetical protein